MRIIRLGIIGLGYIGKIHHRHILKIPNAEVSAAADLSIKALNKLKSEGVKKTYTDYKDMLKDPQIDAVIIALPTHLHARCAIETAEAHKDIFLEKPMARTPEEANAILSAAERNSVKLMIGYPYRFFNRFCEIKEEISSGQLGDIEGVNAAYLGSGPFLHRAEGHIPIPVPDWWFNKRLTGGGALIDLGSHIIDLLRMFFGEITEIKSLLGYRFNMDFEDSAICIAKFSSGTVAQMNVGWYSQEYFFKVDLFGSVKNCSITHAPSSPLSTVVQMLTSGRSKFYQPHFDELQYFVDCLTNDVEPSPSGYDGLRNVEAISSAYKNQIILK
jgi:UDP-N-acetylglucosamine 3-dehydrogenase